MNAETFEIKNREMKKIFSTKESLIFLRFSHFSLPDCCRFVDLDDKMSDDSWSSQIAFRALCEFFESVSNETSKPKKKEKLDRFFVACRSHMTNTSSNKAFSLFPVVR